MPLRSLFPSFCLLLIGAVSFAQAQPAQTAGFPFLKLEPSARGAALGGAFSAVFDDDSNGLFYNPALLNPAMHGGLSLSYLNHLAGVNAGFISYVYDAGAIGSIGGGLRYLSYGTIDRTDAQGQQDGTFNASDAALTIGLSRELGPGIRYGINVHGIMARADEMGAQALAMDFGVLLHHDEQQLTLSASVHNSGRVYQSLGSEADVLPFDVRVGISKRLQHVPILLSMTGYGLHDIASPEDAGLVNQVFQHLVLGGEFQFSPAFHLRAGYNHRRHEMLKMKSRLDFAGAGLGFGLNLRRFRFDYAYNSWSSLGGLHQLTVRTVL